jgi:hypothetical protein
VNEGPGPQSGPDTDPPPEPSEPPAIDIGSAPSQLTATGGPPLITSDGEIQGAGRTRERDEEAKSESSVDRGDRSGASEGAGENAAAPTSGRAIFDRLLKVIAPVAESATFPLFLFLLAAMFLLIQDRIDRNDPKLAAAPIRAEPLSFRSPHSGAEG